MTTETLILKTQLSNLFHPHIINRLCRNGYLKTGNKFSLEFYGSKGYLSHLEISCEGSQNEDNRLSEIFNKDGSIKKKVINVYHSEKNGVRLSLGSDKARVVEKPKYENKFEAVPANENESADMWWKTLNHETRVKYATEQLNKRGQVFRYNNDGLISGFTLSDVVELFRHYA